MVRGSSCGWLRSRPPIPAQSATSAEQARRVPYGPMTSGWCRDPDLVPGVTPQAFPAGSRHRPAMPRSCRSARASCARLRKGIDLAGRLRDLPGAFNAPGVGERWPAICPLGAPAVVAVRPVRAIGSNAASYQQVEEPVSQLINDFSPPVASAAAARQRATRCLPRQPRPPTCAGPPSWGRRSRDRARPGIRLARAAVATAEAHV